MTSAPRRNFAGCSGASQPASMMACEHTDPILKTATLLRRASSTASSKAHVGGDSNEVLNRRTGGERDGVDASLAHCPHERFRRSEVVGHRPSKRVGADGPPMEAACTPSGQERYLFVAAPICSNADGVASEGSEHGPMVRADCFLAEQSCIESGSSVVAEGTRPAGSTRLARLAEGIVPAGHCVQDLVVGAIADEDATGDLAVSDRDPAMHLAEWVGELQAVVGGFGTPKAGDLHPQQFELGGKLSSAEGGDAATQSVGHHSGHLVAGRDQPIDPLVMACYLADGRDRGGRWLRKCHRSPHRHARQFLSPASSASSCRGLIPAEKTTMSASSRSPEACRRPVTRSSPSIRSVAKLRWVVIPSSVTHERSMVAAGPSSCWGIRRSAISTTWVVRLRFRVTDVGRAAHETSDGLCVGPNLRTLQLRPGLYLPIFDAEPSEDRGTIVALGLTSFFTDISSEMVAAILPLYLTTRIGFGVDQFGLFDGVFAAATVVMLLVGGFFSDRWQRPKTLAVGGYAMSTASRRAVVYCVADPVSYR
ncbi:hypothetical protein GQR58_030576 [Nymphon striatum]|nr:hypothetical protein GQR58_030576 [Nymphon striatum]